MRVPDNARRYVTSDEDGVLPDFITRHLVAKGDVSYTATFTEPADTWTIPVPNTFARLPSVTLYSPDGVQVESDITVTLQTVTVTFPVPYAGSALLS